MTESIEFIRKIRKSGNETFVSIPKPLADGLFKNYFCVKIICEDWTDEKTNETIKCVVLFPIKKTNLEKGRE